MTDKIELTPEEATIVLKWATDYPSFSPSVQEDALAEKIIAFLKAHNIAM